MNILKYKLFLEARLSDLITQLKGSDSSDTGRQIKKLKDAEFDFSKRLVKDIPMTINDERIQFIITWYDNANHDIQGKLKSRTSFRSAEEFNDILSNAVHKMFPYMIGKEITSSGRYCLYIIEYNMSIIVDFNINMYINKNYKLHVVSVLPGLASGNYVKNDIIYKLTGIIHI